MVVGQTGSGKTTLLNSFINYLLGIQYEDIFRYKIIQEDFWHNRIQDESQANEVTVYWINNHNNNPSIIIIDKSEFDDTKGIKQVIDIAKKKSGFFIDKLSEINTIYFVCNLLMQD